MKQTGLPFDVSLDLFKEVFENVPDIAVNLLTKNFTVDTVKTHLGNIFSKTGTSDRTRAAVWAVTKSWGFDLTK